MTEPRKKDDMDKSIDSALENERLRWHRNRMYVVFACLLAVVVAVFLYTLASQEEQNVTFSRANHTLILQVKALANAHHADSNRQQALVTASRLRSCQDTNANHRKALIAVEAQTRGQSAATRRDFIILIDMLAPLRNCKAFVK